MIKFDNSTVTVLSMLEEIQKHKRDKSELLELYVQARLQKSLQTYYSQLLHSADVLARRDEKKAIERITQNTKRTY